MRNEISHARIGIIGAMQVEVDLLIQAMRSQGAVSMKSVASRDFYEGNLNGTPVVVVQCGVGMVNAALCAQALITSFSTTAVINTGIAGSLDPAIDIGDVVLSTDSINHIMDVQNLGYQPGQTPGIDVVGYPASETLRKAPDPQRKAFLLRITKVVLHQEIGSYARMEKRSESKQRFTQAAARWRAQQLRKRAI